MTGAQPVPDAVRTARPRQRPQQHPRRGGRPRRGFGVDRPGTYARTPAWWSREHWRSELYADLHTDDVRELRAGVGTRGPVSVRACYALAVALSACADGRTGRNALPGNAALTAKADTLDPDADDYWTRLAASTGYGTTTIQKAEQVLVARGWLARVRTGKNWLTRAERQELWRAGSAARQRRNVWACTTPPHRRLTAPQTASERLTHPAQAATTAAARSHPVDNRGGHQPDSQSGCDLPTTRRVSGLSSVPDNKIFKPEQTSRTGASRRPPTKDVSNRRTYRGDGRTVRLAKDLKTRVYWLRDTPHQRIMPALDRFAKAGWTAADIQRELDQMLATRGWEVPSHKITTTAAGREHHYPLRCPWGYLAMLLRTLDPTDLTAEHEHQRALRQAQDAYEQLRRTGPQCPHGQPAGDVPSPIKGIPACPLCRRAT